MDLPINRTARRATLALALAACSAEPPLAPDADPLPAPGGAPTSGSSGRFNGLEGHVASGGVRFLVSEGAGSITFEADFRSTPVPDPHVYLNTTADANRGSPLRISTLVSASGAQSYSFRLPAGISYTHVLVWCDRYNVGVGAARVN